MILNLKQLQDSCKTILSAVDGSSTTSIVSETLELKTLNKQLLLSVTNREYFVTVKMDIDSDETFKAVVDAQLFLNLISKLTSENIELTVSANNLNIKANGNYKLPFITDENGIVNLTPIILENKTLEFSINTDILNSIVNYNAKELFKNNNQKLLPVQQHYYIDEQGAVTSTNTRACINTFTLEKPVKLLLNSKIIKLFSLFKGSNVIFSLGYDQSANNDLQTKICLKDDYVELNSIILNDSKMFAALPVSALRDRANTVYPYLINLDKDLLVQTINRLLLFKNNNSKVVYGVFKFDKTQVTIYDQNKNNNETISYVSTTLDNLTQPYETILDLLELKALIETSQEKYLTLSFGNHQAIMISKGQIKSIISEGH